MSGAVPSSRRRSSFFPSSFTPEKKVISTREKINRFLEDPNSSRCAAVYGAFINFVACCSCIVLFISTLDSMNQQDTGARHARNFFICDTVVTIVFTLDFVARLCSSASLMCGNHAFFKGWLNWFDLASVLPYYMDLVDLNLLGIFRLFRLLRILKITRSFSGTEVLIIAIERSVAPLKLSVRRRR